MNKKKILLAEDDEDDRQFFEDFVSSREDLLLLGIAENGEQVFEYLQNVSVSGVLPDVIILDQNMPKRNGLQTLEMLKNDDAFGSIPVIIYSTYADSSLTQKSLQAGAASVFSKPFTPDGYDGLINNILAII